jgi:hypothetical protein
LKIVIFSAKATGLSLKTIHLAIETRRMNSTMHPAKTNFLFISLMLDAPKIKYIFLLKTTNTDTAFAHGLYFGTFAPINNSHVGA